MIAERIELTGSAKETNRWFPIDHAYVSFDHPFDLEVEHALNIDFVNEGIGPGARVAVELTEQAARDLVDAILLALDQAGRSGATQPPPHRR
jgi:hypothetical protein